MRAWVRPVVLLSAGMVVAVTGAALALPVDRPPASVAPERRNIVLVLTDDLSLNLLPYMPQVQRMQREGATFDRFFVSNSLCCPSRVSMLTGRYPHNTGIYTNYGPDGGFQKFHLSGQEESTLATDLQAAGYATAFMGKYLNGYRPGLLPTGENNYVPPGWTEWAAAGNDAYDNVDYGLNEDGTLVHYGQGPEDYLTDVLTNKAMNFIARSNAAQRPFFLEVSTFAPHGPFTPAPRHADAFPGLRAPTGPAFDAVATNPPRWLQGRPPIGPSLRTRMDEAFRLRAQSVLAIDELIGAIRAQLRAVGAEDTTYVMFTSDNGFHLGEHRLALGKRSAFDYDIRVPFIVVGPDAAPGTTVTQLAQNVDLRPTLADIAGTTPSEPVDGLTLYPAIIGDQGPTRGAALVEYHGMALPTDPNWVPTNGRMPPSYNALRLPHELYVEYLDGEVEYYDMARDPDQLVNAANVLSPQRKAELHRQLTTFLRCAGSSCHLAT